MRCIGHPAPAPRPGGVEVTRPECILRGGHVKIAPSFPLQIAALTPRLHVELTGLRAPVALLPEAVRWHLRHLLAQVVWRPANARWRGLALPPRRAILASNWVWPGESRQASVPEADDMQLDRMDELRETLMVRLEEGESEFVDFKQAGYVLDTDQRKACFVKDILALSNSCEGPSDLRHIFVGVCRDVDGVNHSFPGVAQHPDDADLQNLVRDWTNALPRFSYVVLPHAGVSLGVYELKGGPHIPCVPHSTRTTGNTLWGGVVYVRHGSRNDVATPEEIHAIVQRRDLWGPGRAMTPQSDASHLLSPAEEELLVAATGAGGDVYILTTDQTGPFVMAGNSSYVDPQDPSIAATYRNALQNLISAGYVRQENASAMHFTLTDNGWQSARDVRRRRSPSLVPTEEMKAFFTTVVIGIANGEVTTLEDVRGLYMSLLRVSWNDRSSPPDLRRVLNDLKTHLHRRDKFALGLTDQVAADKFPHCIAAVRKFIEDTWDRWP